MRHRRLRRLGLLSGALLVVGAIGACGHRRWHDPERMKERALDHLEDTLEDTPLSPEQEQATKALLDRAFAAFGTARQSHKNRLDQALGLFGAEALDSSAVEQLKLAQRAEMEKMSDEVAQAIIELHDILTPEQRQVLVAEIREHRKDCDR